MATAKPRRLSPDERAAKADALMDQLDVAVGELINW